MVFLGFQVDSVRPQLIFPPEKLRKIKQQAKHLHQQRVTVRNIARFFLGRHQHQHKLYSKLSFTTEHYSSLLKNCSALCSVVLCSVLFPWENHSMETEDMTMKFSTNMTLNMGDPNDLRWCTLDKKVHSPSTLDAVHDHRIGCLQHGVGTWQGHREMVSHSPHKLPRTTSCISSTTILCWAQQ